MVNIKLNGKTVSVPEGLTILEAARQNGVKIPSLCNYGDIHKIGSCRVCVVEVAGSKALQAACVTTVRENMDIKTNSPKVRAARRTIYELLISDHPKDCLNCERNQSCELQALGETLGITNSRFEGERSSDRVDVSPSVTRDTAKCILCRRCVTVCNEIQQVGAIAAQNRGFNTVISPSMELPLNSSECAMCGQCTVVCPTGALKETDGIEIVWNALADPKKRVIVQTAPAVRAALGECFGMPAGTRVTGKMVSALHELGFDDVFDTNFSADLTIMEEGTELLHRLTDALTGKKAVLPMITSCSPGWIKHIEHAYPSLLGHLSTCKSPHMMMGALVKSFYAEKIGVDPKDIFMVSIMPCTAKKFEIQRPEMNHNGIPNVDAVLTTRELGRMIKSAGIDFNSLPDTEFDSPLGLSTGAADIFGVTGGVMEAALRTVYELVTKRELPFDGLHVAPIVGLDQIKTASLKFENVLPQYAHLEGVTVNVAVTSGLAGANILMDQIRDNSSPYHFIEVMGCPGGCISGGGQPRPTVENFRIERMKALYSEDECKSLRKSHENPDLLRLYADYLGNPGSHKAHELLHTTYTPRGLYNELL
ncbi:MAG: NADH-dependent [FeFe] hydrogenase, group A6 [Oscillospiraceae bacterium]|jgi:NADP-reducing hydrogenase subunit HndD